MIRYWKRGAVGWKSLSRKGGRMKRGKTGLIVGSQKLNVYDHANKKINF